MHLHGTKVVVGVTLLARRSKYGKGGSRWRVGQPTQTRSGVNTPIKTTPPEVYRDGEPIEINGNYDPPDA